jgi:antibiotic biosynthesis monooxygenase (ABM) superfamily enzyme
VAVVAGLIPVSVAVTYVRQAVAPNLPPLAALAISAVANVVILTWLIMPPLTRMLSGWLTK